MVVAKCSSLLGCDTLCLGGQFPAFWRNSAYIFKGQAVMLGLQQIVNKEVSFSLTQFFIPVLQNDTDNMSDFPRV